MSIKSDDTNRMIDVMQAYVEGRPIEELLLSMTMADWKPTVKPDWNWALYNYRVGSTMLEKIRAKIKAAHDELNEFQEACTHTYVETGRKGITNEFGALIGEEITYVCKHCGNVRISEKIL